MTQSSTQKPKTKKKSIRARGNKPASIHLILPAQTVPDSLIESLNNIIKEIKSSQVLSVAIIAYHREHGTLVKYSDLKTDNLVAGAEMLKINIFKNIEEEDINDVS